MAMLPRWTNAATQKTNREFKALFGRSARLHGIIAATWITPSYITDGLGLVLLALIWYHCYRLVRRLVLLGKVLYVNQKVQQVVSLTREQDALKHD